MTTRSKSARRYRQSCLEYAPATVSRPARPKVTTLPCRTAGVQKRVPLPPEPSRVRPFRGFAAREAKSDDISAPLPPEPSRVRVGSWCALLDVRWEFVTVRCSASSLVCIAWCAAPATVSRPSTTLPRKTAVLGAGRAGGRAGGRRQRADGGGRECKLKTTTPHNDVGNNNNNNTKSNSNNGIVLVLVVVI